MSSINTPKINSYVAGADLSAATNETKAVKFDSNGDIVLATAGDLAIGSLHSLGNTGEHVEVATFGGSARGTAAATITAGDLLKSDANGDLVIANVADDLAIAIAGENAVDNDEFEVIPMLVRIHA